jgi:NIMA (never in mitosis gene a)-related kinase
MEFADDGDLYQKIVERKKKKELFEEEDIWSVLIQTVSGLRTLHQLNILHRDLKVLISALRAPTSS